MSTPQAKLNWSDLEPDDKDAAEANVAAAGKWLKDAKGTSGAKLDWSDLTPDDSPKPSGEGRRVQRLQTELKAANPEQLQKQPSEFQTAFKQRRAERQAGPFGGATAQATATPAPTITQRLGSGVERAGGGMMTGVGRAIAGTGRLLHVKPTQELGEGMARVGEYTSAQGKAHGSSGVIGDVEEAAGGVAPILAVPGGAVGMGVTGGVQAYGGGASLPEAALQGAVTGVGVAGGGALASRVPIKGVPGLIARAGAATAGMEVPQIAATGRVPTAREVLPNALLMGGLEAMHGVEPRTKPTLQHERFGEVTKAEDQSGVQTGHIRVEDTAGDTHIIQNPRTTGNRSATFVKPKETAATESQRYNWSDLQPEPVAEPAAPVIQLSNRPEPQVSATPDAATNKPKWVKQNIDQRNELAERTGVADQIEELSAQGKTAREIANIVAPKLNAADRTDAIGTVYAVKAKRGIPSMDDKADFERWRQERTANEETGSQTTQPEVSIHSDERQIIDMITAKAAKEGIPVEPLVRGRDGKTGGLNVEFRKVQSEVSAAIPEVRGAASERIPRTAAEDAESARLAAQPDRRTVTPIEQRSEMAQGWHDLRNPPATAEAPKVEASGKPRTYRVYHGTNQEFENFDPQRGPFQFAPDEEGAQRYANIAARSGGTPTIKAADVTLHNNGWERLQELQAPSEPYLSAKDAYARLKAEGYDGFHEPNGITVAFSPEQVRPVKPTEPAPVEPRRTSPQEIADSYAKLSEKAAEEQRQRLAAADQAKAERSAKEAAESATLRAATISEWGGEPKRVGKTWRLYDPKDSNRYVELTDVERAGLGRAVEPKLTVEGGQVTDAAAEPVHHSEFQERDTETQQFSGPPEGYTPKDERLPETTGIARRVEEARRGLVADSTGGIGAQESVEHGREMLRAGRDPQGVVDDFEKTGAVSADAMALVRAKHEELARAANQAFDKGGLNSPEFKAAENARQDFWEQSVRPMQTAWSNTGRAQQGETAIDTGTFYGIYRAFKQETGREMSPREQARAKQIADRVAASDKGVDSAEKALIDRLNKATGIGDLAPDVQQAVKRLIDESRRETRAQGRRATRKTLDEEAVVIKTNLAAAFKKVTQGSGTHPAGLAGIDPEGEITKYVVQYAKNRVKAGIVDSAQLIDDVHAAIKDFADVGKREVAEVLAGLGNKPGEKRGPTDWMKAKGEIKKGLKTEDVARNLADVGKRLAAGEQMMPADVKAIWQHANEAYIDKGVEFGDTVQKLATDLGATPEQVRRALATLPGTKPLADAVYRRMAARRQMRGAAEQWVKNADRSPGLRAVQGVADAFFNLKTFGHGTVGPVTHAGENIFHPSRWVNYFKNMGRTYKAAYSSAAHERYMQDLVNDPNYTIARRGGLKNEPGKFYDEYQNNLAAKMFGEIGKIGNRGFDILKTMRQDFFNQRWNKLEESQKTPEMAKAIADLANHSTGAISSQLPAPNLTRGVFFAAPLEMSRWARILGDPVRAVDKFINWKSATPADKYFAKSVVRNHAEFLATYVAALALNQAVLSATKSDDKVNFTDPSKGDWLRLKIKGRAIEPTGGLISTLDFLGKLGQAALGTQDPRQGRFEHMGRTATQYGRGKLSPFASTVVDVASQSDFTGRPLPFSKDKEKQGKPRYSWPEYLITQQTPIPVAEAARDFFEEMHKQGVPIDTTKAIFSAAWHHPGSTTRAGGIGIASGSTGVRIGTEYVPRPSKTTIPNPAKQLQRMMRMAKPPSPPR